MAGLVRRRARRQRVCRWVVLVVAVSVLPAAAARDARVHHPGPRRHGSPSRPGGCSSTGASSATTYPSLCDGHAGLARAGRSLTVARSCWCCWCRPWSGSGCGCRGCAAVEFICLLPLTIPAIVLVVGLAPVYAGSYYFLGGSSLTLDVRLHDPGAARTPTARIDAGLSRDRRADPRPRRRAASGASWATVMWRVVLPNIRSAVLSAAFLTVALVLGEFTIASLLNRDNLQVAINLLGKSSATMSVAVSLAALVLAFVLLFAARPSRGAPALPAKGRPRRPQVTRASNSVAVRLDGFEPPVRRGRTPSTGSTSTSRPGELVALLGPSGCGKTTALRISPGSRTPTRAGSLVDGTGHHRTCRPTGATWAWCSRRTACSRT